MIPVSAPTGPPDWARIDRGLCESYALTPAGIDGLTLPEILVLSLPAGRDADRGLSPEEVAEWARERREATPLQRLAIMRRDRGDG